jgi:hypothetical protein
MNQFKINDRVSYLEGSTELKVIGLSYSEDQEDFIYTLEWSDNGEIGYAVEQEIEHIN